MYKEWLNVLNSSPLFDADWYKATYNIVDTDAATHYAVCGYKNLYDPSPKFSTAKYYEAYPDILNADCPALVHFELYGKKEGKVCFESTHPSKRLAQGKNKSGISRAAYCPESAFNRRVPVEDLIEKLKAYDVISFDVFDTLILRNIKNPTDLFRLMAAQIGEPDFLNLRVLAERQAVKEVGAYYTVTDIYAILSKMIDIDIDFGIKTEFELEKKLCVANPYFKTVFNELIKLGKKVIICSDMYLPENMLSELLNSCGYSNLGNLFVSCDKKCSKGDSSIQNLITQALGNNLKYIHIGDNYQSDILGSEHAGWDTVYYPKCSEKSSIFYDDNSCSLVSSIATGICCNKFNATQHEYTKEYEHGFRYGGILVAGFCDWINTYAKQNGVEQIWFLARDMNIVHKCYNKYYNEFDNAYVSASRAAAMQLNVEQNPEQFFKYSFSHKANLKSASVETVLSEAQLNCLIKYLTEYSIKADSIFDNEVYDRLHSLYFDHISDVVGAFDNAVAAADSYFRGILNGKRTVCLTDLGWSGTIMQQLRKFLIRRGIADKVYCAMLASNDVPSTSDLTSRGEIETYLYSTYKNCDLKIDAYTVSGNTQMMCLEAMFSSSEPTLIAYSTNENGEIQHKFGIKTALDWQIEDIQKGITDFVGEYSDITNTLPFKLRITPYDAFRPYLSISDDFSYLYLMFESVREYADNSAASDNTARVTTYGEIMKSRNLI